jgi:hypothetical protein
VETADRAFIDRHVSALLLKPAPALKS